MAEHAVRRAWSNHLRVREVVRLRMNAGYAACGVVRVSGLGVANTILPKSHRTRHTQPGIWDFSWHAWKGRGRCICACSGINITYRIQNGCATGIHGAPRET
eukprot:scaffold9107_cov112-Isochrysis_galbana.AAC.2